MELGLRHSSVDSACIVCQRIILRRANAIIEDLPEVLTSAKFVECDIYYYNY